MEENRIKKELGEIAMALNLEAQKAKSDLNNFVKYVTTRDLLSRLIYFLVSWVVIELKKSNMIWNKNKHSNKDLSKFPNL